MHNFDLIFFLIPHINMTCDVCTQCRYILCSRQSNSLVLHINCIYLFVFYLCKLSVTLYIVSNDWIIVTCMIMMFSNTYGETEKNHKIRLVTLNVWVACFWHITMRWMYYIVPGEEGVRFMDNSYIPFGMKCFTVFVSHLYVMFRACWRHLYVSF
jgi:hypothetical protein